jgi:4-diphosphocytidyl-2-C-methyl-D-erythritol kinase
VFKAWDGVDRGALPRGDARQMALEGRNDLEEPAIRLCPQIADVLTSLRRTDATLVRMSGSGATCFALYSTIEDRDNALHYLQDSWWTMTARLR